MAPEAPVKSRSLIELTSVHASAAANARQQTQVIVPANNGAAACSADLLSFSTPQHLRDALQGVDKLERDHKVGSRNSIGIGLTALSGTFAAAPSLLTASQACPAGTDKSNKQACFANGAAVADAVIGIVGLGYTVWGAVLGRTHHRDQIKQMDYELEQRYRVVAEQSRRTVGQSVQQPHNSSRIASRYLALKPNERKQILDELFNRYITDRSSEISSRST